MNSSQSENTHGPKPHNVSLHRKQNKKHSNFNFRNQGKLSFNPPVKLFEEKTGY